MHDRVLEKIIRPKSEDVIGGCKMLHSEKLHDLYFTRNITWAISSRITRSAAHVACMGERRGAYKV
jgi:hypothetical protein